MVKHSLEMVNTGRKENQSKQQVAEDTQPIEGLPESRRNDTAGKVRS